jgi:quercetin dioxygenase-like cupin family protein
LISISGSAIYEDENRKVELQPGTYVMIEPFVKHRVVAIEESELLLMR